MKRIIIIGEGQTEASFCNDVLIPHFSLINTYIQNPVIKKTGGGIVNWTALKYQIVRHLLEDNSVYVTTLIDYYGIHQHHQFPAWDDAKKIIDKNARMDLLENAMLNEIELNLRDRFIPYIQLHEFEGLLFSDLQVFDDNFSKNEFSDYDYLIETINQYPNPELINNGNETAPSKRLSKIIKGYYSENENYKVLYGALLSHDIGLNKIRAKCPRFNDWVTKLEQL